MNKEKRLRRLKAIIGAQNIVRESASQSYKVEVPGYGLRGMQRAGNPHDAINQAIQEWARSGEFNPTGITEPLRVKLTDRVTRQTQELSVPVDAAMSGSTSYPLPDFGGYDEQTMEIPQDPIGQDPRQQNLTPEEEGRREGIGEQASGMALIEPVFSEPKILMTDPTFQFEPKTINALIFRSNNKEWITIPRFSQKHHIPHIYELTGTPSVHERYFGVKTEYGYVPTIASAILLHLAQKGVAGRGDISKLEKIKIPEDYRLAGQTGDYMLTLPAHIENAAIRDSLQMIQDAHQNADILRRMTYLPDTDSFSYTTSHSRGTRETPRNKPLSPEMQFRLQVLNRGLAHPIEDYPELQEEVDRFIKGLEVKMSKLLREQHSSNQTSRFIKPSYK